MSEVTCSDPREVCSYRKDYSLSAEYRDGCAIPQDPYTPTSKVTDTLESGGNSICWYDMDSGYAGHEWEEFYSGDAACFCNTSLATPSAGTTWTLGTPGTSGRSSTLVTLLASATLVCATLAGCRLLLHCL